VACRGASSDGKRTLPQGVSRFVMPRAIAIRRGFGFNLPAYGRPILDGALMVIHQPVLDDGIICREHARGIGSEKQEWSQ